MFNLNTTISNNRYFQTLHPVSSRFLFGYMLIYKPMRLFMHLKSIFAPVVIKNKFVKICADMSLTRLIAKSIVLRKLGFMHARKVSF